MKSEEKYKLLPAPEVVLASLGPPVRERVLIDDRTFVIVRPSDSDRLLDHPAVHSAFEADEYLPYWADLWPAARMLAKAILRESWTPGLEALEIGCGLGLPGIAALAKGLRVTFTDYDPTALRFAADNARLNGFEQFQVLQLDWRSPPSEFRFPVVLGSDLIYEVRNVAPLVHLLKHVLAPEGLCLLTDQDRVPSQLLRETLSQEGLAFATQILRAGEPGGRRLKGTLYRIKQSAARSSPNREESCPATHVPPDAPPRDPVQADQPSPG
jgi:predicted nicotinamide N-methyase